MKSTASARSRRAVAGRPTTEPSHVHTSDATANAASGAVDAARQQVVVATEAACALFRGFEAMRKVQEQAAHEALGRHADAGRKLRGSTSPADVIAMQADLLRGDFEAALRYWQSLAAASLEMQTELVGCTTQLVDSDAVMEQGACVKAMPYEMAGLRAFFGMVPPFMNVAGRDEQPPADAS